MSIGLLGQKIGMTSVYDANGRMRPVTVIAAGDNVLLRRVTAENDGYSAIKVGFGAPYAFVAFVAVIVSAAGVTVSVPLT